jgi:hypothetical protein
VTTRRFDVCNGDADGLCAALQWRLHEPAPATLQTGLKREITLLERVHANAGDEVNVFDLSMQRNRAALLGLLGADVRVRYFDHHAVRDIPSHPLLEVQVDCASDICTSLLVDRCIGGAFRAWALVGAYGDNLAGVADRWRPTQASAAMTALGCAGSARQSTTTPMATTRAMCASLRRACMRSWRATAIPETCSRMKALPTRSTHDAAPTCGRPWLGRRIGRTHAAAC